MTYRDDEDAQRARIEELERKLASASSEIAVLKGETHTASPGAKLRHSRVSNGPIFFEREIALPYAISELGYEAIASVLRTRLRLDAAQVGRTLVVPGVFALERAGEGTRVRLTGDWYATPVGVMAIAGMTGVGGGVVTAAALADIVTHGLGVLHSYPVDVGLVALALGTLISVTVGTTWATRRSISKSSAQQLADYEGTFAAIVALAEEHAVRAVPPTRVAEPSEASEDEEASVSSSRPATRQS